MVANILATIKLEEGMERILHMVGAMCPGGMENFIMNVYENIDCSKVQFDIIVHQREDNDYVELIESMGGRVYLLPRLTKHPLKNLRMIYKIVKENKYQVVIRHTASALVTPQLLAARMAGAKRTMCHSHSEQDPAVFLHKLGRCLMGLAVTDPIACSKKAGQWMYGKRECVIIQNAIDIEKFQYQESLREKIKQEFGLNEGKVYGHVGNFSDVKNHTYLLKIFAEIAKVDESARFFLLGDGSLRPQIEEERKQLGLEDKVFLTGMRRDVNAFFSCFDVLLFPSKFEGLPLTIIEAQAAGLPCLISDVITKNVVLTESLIHFASIGEEPRVWAKQAMELAGKGERTNHRRELAEAGYDIHQLAAWYEDMVLCK